MGQLEYFMYLIDHAIDTKQKRHITGGILISMSLMLCGLAFTVMTTKEDEK